MSNLAIRVEGLSKRYRLGQRRGYNTVTDVVTRALSAPIRRVRRSVQDTASRDDRRSATPGAYMWALKDVSFDVKRGEVVGIIGRNGAGKSTLLKILSQITTPTAGYAQIRGRVGSLLEVGSGFHPELTGRENVYLNGTILGMKKAEVDRKFDAIVAFSEIEKFIDTPVKHYSSGMYMRLAFAVAAHLEPEILIVDEVLAVGDAAFQRKCLGKIDDVSKGGRTVLFVSHNMTAVQSLCERVIWLHEGKVVEQDRAAQVVSSYLKTSFSTTTAQLWPDLAAAPGNARVRLRAACVRPASGSSEDPITIRTPFVMEFDYWNLQPEAYLNLSLHVYNEQGIMVFNTVPVHEPEWQGRPFPVGLFRSQCHVPGDLLNDGMHRVELMVVKDQSEVIYRHDDLLMFDVRDVVEMRSAWFGKWGGAVRPKLQWCTELLQADASLAASAPVSSS